MTYPLNTRVRGAIEPPIAEARSWLDGVIAPDGMALLDLSQAVPGYPPPPELVAHMAQRLSDPATHRYTDITGLPALRRALAHHMGRVYGADIPESRVAITAGCNQAYCLAIQALAGEGDEVVLPLPYYFNHQMWLDMLGIRAAHLPFRPERGGVPDPADAAAAIGPRTRAIVLVSPNNPTGAIYSPEVLAEFAALARRHEIALVIDETYKDFLPTDGRPHGLFDDPAWADTVVQLYSFSKAFCLTGHRVGAILGAERLIAEVAKEMDCVAICAPRVGQEAALHGLEALGRWVAGNTAMMRERAAAVRRAFEGANHGYELVSLGAYFAYLRHPFRDTGARDVARRLARELNMLVLPGDMFGPGQDDYLRVAFANVAAEMIPEMARRLALSR